MKRFSLPFILLALIVLPYIAQADSPVLDSAPGTALTIDRVFRIIEYAVNTFFTICMLVAVGYAVYGGFMIATAGGDSAKVTIGRKTMTNAFIGIALILAVGIIVNSIASLVADPEGFL